MQICDICVYITNLYVHIANMEICILPLSVSWAPYYVNEAELDHSYFFGRRRTECEWSSLDTGTKNALKRKRALRLLFSFLSSNCGTILL